MWMMSRHQSGVFLPASIEYNGAAWMKPAARWDLDGVGRSALQNNALLAVPGIGDGDHGEQRLGIRVVWIIKHLMRGTGLYNSSQVHYGNNITEELHNSKIMGNKEQGQVEFRLNVF